jgi:hypothetical protein
VAGLRMRAIHLTIFITSTCKQNKPKQQQNELSCDGCPTAWSDGGIANTDKSITRKVYLYAQIVQRRRPPIRAVRLVLWQ